MHQQTLLAAFALTRRRALLATGALLAAGGAGAQSWPAKPIKLVVPWPPGGPTDTGSRIVGLALADRLGQPVVVENRPGASGSIAYQQVIKTPGDGSTFVMLATPDAIDSELVNDPNSTAKHDSTGRVLLPFRPRNVSLAT